MRVRIYVKTCWDCLYFWKREPHRAFFFCTFWKVVHIYSHYLAFVWCWPTSKRRIISNQSAFTLLTNMTNSLQISVCLKHLAKLGSGILALMCFRLNYTVINDYFDQWDNYFKILSTLGLLPAHHVISVDTTLLPWLVLIIYIKSLMFYSLISLRTEIAKGGYFLNVQLRSEIGEHYPIASCEAFVLHIYIHSEFHIMIKIGDTWSVKWLSQ